MRSELTVKTRSLAGTSDLTLLAPIKPGLVPSLESVTYKTRVKRLLATLNAGRTSSHEYSLLRPFSDAVERVGKIHSVRVAIVEPDRILLSVTFDGGQESYLRVLWQKVGTLLDLIFCSSEGYVTAWGHSFEEWADWVKKVQIETDFFYGMPAQTVDDVQYLRNEEFRQRQVPGAIPADLLAARQTVQSAEELAWSVHRPTPLPHVIKDLGRQGLRALALIYRLTAYYLPDSPGRDGDILHRAARELLVEFLRLHKRHLLDAVIKEGRKRFDEQITWLLKGVEPREVPALPDAKPEPDLHEGEVDVQAGIISSHPGKPSHGCLLLVAFRDRPAAAKFLLWLAKNWITREPRDREHALSPAKSVPVTNIAFTYEGLRALGLSEAQLGLFPQEFREGMEARASVLGDFRTNHPRRWRLPTRNFPGITSELVELSSVHAVVQLRTADGPPSLGESLDERDPLFQRVTDLFDEHRDVELLSVQPMLLRVNEKGTIREHFGFADGKAQPVLDPKDNGKVYDRNQVQLGELLLGYANEAEKPDVTGERHEWLHNGSFLVVRKLSQDVKALEDAVDAAAAATRLDKELILAKLVGRWRNGDPIVDRETENDFDYSSESPPGSLCPFHAHIRRTNPRLLDDPDLPPPPGRRTPRLMRRGMSYGPEYDPRRPESSREPRGLVFMAYNASIAEQFEVVQRWISGGNSSGGYSGQSDALLGVPPNGQQRFFRFEHEGKIYRVALDGSEAPLGDPRPFVRLEWGIYLFTPSIKALKEIAKIAEERAGDAEKPVWSVDAGRKRIDELMALVPEENPTKEQLEEGAQAWKTALEDPDAQRYFHSAGIWAAIRRDFRGVLDTRTPYGIIVGDRKLVQDVLDDPHDLYSVEGDGYHKRMLNSIGEIYLGLDDKGADCPYLALSTALNTAIGALRKKEDAFDHARDAATEAIKKLVDNEKVLAGEFGEPRWELNLDVKEVVDKALEELCRKWFGLPEKKCEIQPGGARWDWKVGQPPFYPGHFTAPSRYIFQPHPGKEVETFGHLYGEALQRAFGDLVRRHRDAKEPVLNPDAPLTKAILAAFPRRDQDDLLARTIVGGMMGFLPTMDGNVRLSLNEWLRDGSFWSLRTALAERASSPPFNNAEDLLEPVLKRTMQLRPSPELIWRIAKQDDRIGNVPIKAGDRIVISIVSATQQCLETSEIDPAPDVYPIFGGDRGSPPHPKHPTHACPGYEAAMGGLLGILSALLEVKESMRPSVAPLALTLEGDLRPADPPATNRAPVGRKKPPIPRPAWLRVLEALAGRRVALWSARRFAPSTFGTGRLLVADGDSWMSYSRFGPFGSPQNIAAYLQTQHGFEVEILASLGTRLYDFYDDDDTKLELPRDQNAKDSARLDRLLTTVKRMVVRGRTPAAILLSAAGTDVVEERLLALLNDNAPGGQPLDEQLVSNMVDTLMRRWLEHVLDRITAECKTPQRVQIPIFIHGYDFPVPDCRYIAGLVSEQRAWLYPNFKIRNYESQTWRHYPAMGTPIMETLIKRLNKMQALVAGLPRFNAHVFHVNLTGTLSSMQAGYASDWDNELHPSVDGFTALTRKFADAVAKHAL